MLNAIKLHFSQNKTLLIATLISLLLHALFLNKFTLSLPELNTDHQPLEMRLVHLPPAPKAVPTPTKKEPPVKKTKQKPAPKPVPEQKPEPKIEPTTPEETPISGVHDVNPLAEATTQQEPIPEAMPDSAPVAEQAQIESSVEAVTESGNETAINDDETEPMPPAYQYVKTEFDVFRGGDASAAGTALTTFSINENGSYQINNTVKAKGLASLFFNTLVQKSEGIVTENGLRPNFYSYEYGKNKTQSAHFAWSDGVLLLNTVKGEKTVDLIAGTQDLLSFMYQFMFIPPLETMQITMTNGKNLRTYTYSFEGEETIDSKLGKLKTVHLLKTSGDDEKTELWLGIDYHYLPVKIRKTEKNGNVIEQIITTISTETPQ